MARKTYEAQVALLVRLLPHVGDETNFALKGGTAINLTMPHGEPYLRSC